MLTFYYANVKTTLGGRLMHCKLTHLFLCKVEGYAVQCEFSLDGTILASGSSAGSAHFYDYHNARALHTLQAHSRPCLCVSQHPVLPATAATCDWAGEIKIWH